MIVKTYRDVLAEYQTHPETKSLGPDGQPCDRATVGLLSRRPVKVAAIHYIGKESNKIEEATSGLVTDLDDVLTEYFDPERDPFDHADPHSARQTGRSRHEAIHPHRQTCPCGRPNQQRRSNEAHPLCRRTRASPTPSRRHQAAKRPRSATRHMEGASSP